MMSKQQLRVTMGILVWASALAVGAAAQTTRYVATNGSDTGDCTGAPCRTVQYAVDQATAGDQVKVASGTYTDLREGQMQGQVFIGQTITLTRTIVNITKSLTITGGYGGGDWTTQNPTANPTILDGGYIYTVAPLIGTFQAGETITGGSSGVTAVVSGIDGVRFKLTSVTGNFAANETVTGGTSGATGQIGYAYFITPGSGTFRLAETITGGTSGASGTLVDILGTRFAIAVTSGAFQTGEVVTGATSGATATLADARLPMVGRVVTITNATGVTLDGLQLVNGNSTESGTCPFGLSGYGGSGGGLYIGDATVTLNNLIIANNIGNNAYSLGSGAVLPWQGEEAGAGGGMFAIRSNVTLTNSVISGNNSNQRWLGYGDGILVKDGSLTARANQFVANLGGGTAGWQGYYSTIGNAVCTQNSVATLTGNTISGNGIAQLGGGTAVVVSGTTPGPATIWANQFLNNLGQALSWDNGTVSLRRNLITGNGGGISVGTKGYGQIENNVFLQNGASDADGTAINHGNYATTTDPLTTYSHNTISGSSGNSAIYVESGTASFANTIVAGSAVAINIENRLVAALTLRQTLFDSNGTDITGTPTSDVGHLNGSAAFAADGYHLTSSSAAVDAGIDVGVVDDIDGSVPKRPQGRGPDLGADESPYTAPYTGGAFGLSETASKPRLLTWWPDGATVPSHRIDQEFVIALSNPSNSPAVASFTLGDTFPSGLTFLGEAHAPGVSAATQNGNQLSWQSTTGLVPGTMAWASVAGTATAQAVRTTVTNPVTASYTLASGSTGTLTASASAFIPNFPPFITSPVSGEFCVDESGKLDVSGVSQAGATVRIYEDGTQKAQVTADANGVWTAAFTPASWTAQPQTVTGLTARDCTGGTCSDASPVVTVWPTSFPFCAQKSYWQGTKSGRTLKYGFRDSSGVPGFTDFAVPGYYGFNNTTMMLYDSGCPNPSDVLSASVTADQVTYYPTVSGRWYQFQIGAAHSLSITATCGRASDTRNGTVLIDPDGYVYDSTKGFDSSQPTANSLAGATVTCYVYTPSLGGWVVWPAQMYNDQRNPQVTGADGYFTFLTPPGVYYLQVDPPNGFQSWRSPQIQVVTNPVHANVPLTPTIMGTVPRVTLTPDGMDQTTVQISVGGAVEWLSTLSPTAAPTDVLLYTQDPVLDVKSGTRNGTAVDATSPLGFDSGMVGPGQVYRRQFGQAGTYTFSDGVGHTGQVVVTAAAAPTVTGVVPNSGPAAGGTTVTVSGTNFVAGASVSFGGVAAGTVTVTSGTQLSATTGAHGVGVVDVVVTNPDTQSGTLAVGFTYTAGAPAPTVTGVEPAEGPPAGGTVLLVAGTNFVSGASVTVGGVAATAVAVLSPTAIRAVSGAHAAGVVDVVVTNPDEQSGTLAGSFTYAEPSVRRYYLAEGSTLWTFDTTLAVLNPGTDAAPVTVTFMKEDGTTVVTTRVVAAGAQDTLRVADVAGMEAVSFGTVVESTAGVPLVVERQTTWDGGHGAHGSVASEMLSPTWYFAEGAQTPFATYVLVANPGAVAADLTLTFLRPTEAPVVRTATVGPQARATFWLGAVPELADRSFSIVVTASAPVVAERSVYFGTARHWDGGTSAMGVVVPSTSWTFAEGATGPTFDMYLLLGNPNPTPASVTVTYVLTNGTTVQRTYSVGALRRRTVCVNAEGLGLAQAPGIAMTVVADQPVLAERALYWVAPYATWRAGHAGPGAVAPEMAWGLAGGRVGGSDHAETYLLLANVGATPSQVQVTYLRATGLPPIVQTYTVNPMSRRTVWTNGVAGLANETFGMVVAVLSGAPIVVERSTYWDADGEWWAAGTNALGVVLQLQ